MEKKEFLDVTREYFKSIGFQTFKKSKFYFDNKELTLRVWLMHSNFGEYYYIDYDIRLKALHLDIQDVFNDDVWDSLLAGRLCYNDKKAFEIEYLLWDAKVYLNDLKKLSEISLYPIMLDGLSFIKKIVKNDNNSSMVFKPQDKIRILSL